MTQAMLSGLMRAQVSPRMPAEVHPIIYVAGASPGASVVTEEAGYEADFQDRWRFLEPNLDDDLATRVVELLATRIASSFVSSLRDRDLPAALKKFADDEQNWSASLQLAFLLVWSEGKHTLFSARCGRQDLNSNDGTLHGLQPRCQLAFAVYLMLRRLPCLTRYSDRTQQLDHPGMPL